MEAGKKIRMQGHIDVGGKDGQQEQDQPFGRQALEPGEEQAQSECRFQEATQVDQGQGKGKDRRHDLEIDRRVQEMIGARQDEEQGQDPFQDPVLRLVRGQADSFSNWFLSSAVLLWPVPILISSREKDSTAAASR
ncbi:MAG: hypothetical protein JWO30_671 [Fibrobacteres bacterium]|nr:hypothetical protein [Fibrobacterota bacterium]